jgi:ankyrin repeat protein
MTFEEVEVIKRADTPRLRREIEQGLDPNLSNRYGWSILMIAAMRGNTAIGELLIEAGADLDHRNKFRDTALSLAVQTGHPSFVKLLLASGASLNCHSHGNSLEIFFDWVAQYAAGSKGKVQIENVREMFHDERVARGQAIELG